MIYSVGLKNELEALNVWGMENSLTLELHQRGDVGELLAVDPLMSFNSGLSSG